MQDSPAAEAGRTRLRAPPALLAAAASRAPAHIASAWGAEVDTARAGTHWPTVVIVVAGLFAVAFAGLPALMRLGHGRRHLDWAAATRRIARCDVGDVRLVGFWLNFCGWRCSCSVSTIWRAHGSWPVPQ